jgi:hypothetical protein
VENSKERQGIILWKDISMPKETPQEKDDE